MRALGILFLTLLVLPFTTLQRPQVAVAAGELEASKIGLTVIALAPPAFAAEPGLEAFLGTWEGRWGDRVGTTLVVEKIEGTKALITYRRDAYPRMGLAVIDVKATGQFLDNTTLKVTFPGRGPITFVLTPAGSLAAEAINPDGGVSRATMRKK